MPELNTESQENQQTAAQAAVCDITGSEHGPIYWLMVHTMQFANKHRIKFALMFAASLVVFFLMRGYIHEFIIACRMYFGVLVVGIPSAFITLKLFKKAKVLGKVALIMLLAVLSWFGYNYGRAVHDHFSLWWRYQTLNIVELAKPPITRHERIQPLNSVATMAKSGMSENDTTTTAHFVRLGQDDYRFTFFVEPSYNMARLKGSINRLYSIPATRPDVNFAEENIINVSFQTGPNMLLGRNTYTAICKAFGPWRYLNYEPDNDVIALKDDSGKWVQVVPLIHWRGIIFPWPEFGGVAVIEQSGNSWAEFAKLELFGTGYFVKPKDIAKHPFLKGQNILSYRVSRYMAESFKFQKSFFDPLPGFHDKDIRISDMPDDANEQPFVADCAMSEFSGSDALHHSFTMSPYNPSLTGLPADIFMPADGENKVYVCNYEKLGVRLTGPSIIGQLIMNERKYFDRSHVPVENRPFIRDINGERTRMYLTTLVTKSEKDGKVFIGGNNPDVFITDAKTERSYWMNPPKPETFDEQLKQQMKLPAGSPLLPQPAGATGPATPAVPFKVDSPTHTDSIVPLLTPMF